MTACQRCDRCNAASHTTRECTPAPCRECGGVEAHVNDKCSIYRESASVTVYVRTSK